MLIITTIYLVEQELSKGSSPAPGNLSLEMISSRCDPKTLNRVWVSVHEGKNRVLPMDENK
jgi:hypothetical protein